MMMLYRVIVLLIVKPSVPHRRSLPIPNKVFSEEASDSTRTAITVNL